MNQKNLAIELRFQIAILKELAEAGYLCPSEVDATCRQLEMDYLARLNKQKLKEAVKH